MQNNECTFICEQFTEYKDGSLSVEIQSRVEAHLASCSACHAVFQQIDQVLSQLHHLQPIQTNPNFTNDLMSKVRQLDQKNLWQQIYQSSYSRVAGYAIAAGLVAAIGLNIWIDPISPGASRGTADFAGNKNSPEAALADQADSVDGFTEDSLQMQPGTINSEASSLLLVSGKQ